MKILVKGDTNITREFRCDCCGCRFLASKEEYYFGRFSETPQSRCPNCKRVCYGSYGTVNDPEDYDLPRRRTIRGYTY